MKILLLLAACLISAFGTAQFVVDKTSHDFGDVTRTSNRTVDFHIINNYNFTAIPSSILFDRGFSDAHTPSAAQPGDTILYRVKINPDKKGKYVKTIPFTFFQMDDTIFFELTANVLTTDFEDNKILESFERKLRKGDEKPRDFPVSFLIRDKETKEPIEGASVSISSNTLPFKHLETDEHGMATRVLHHGYSVSISASGYNYVTLNISSGCENGERIVDLTKYSNDGSKSEFDYFYEYEGEHIITNEAVQEKLIPIEDSLLYEPMTVEDFKPNNIVFLMDISGSMTDHGRMDLLKKSMIEMLKPMREIDLVTVIAFNDETRVLIKPTHLNTGNKNYVIAKINNLEPGGMTNGGKGLKLAFKMAQENYNASNNNQVILATDGALNSYMAHKDIIALVKKHTKIIQTSVVTLKGYTWTQKNLKDIVKAGHGHLLPINTAEEAKAMLIKEIKTNSQIISE